MSAADELARRDARFRAECSNQTGQLKPDYAKRVGHDRLRSCNSCQGLGYIPLSGAALLLACVEWCKEYDISLTFAWLISDNPTGADKCIVHWLPRDNRWDSYTFVERVRVSVIQDTAPEAAAAAVLAAMKKED